MLDIVVISGLYIIWIIYIFVKYNMDAKPSQKYEFYRDELELLPAEAGYLLNNDCNNMDLILANILTLVNDGYIRMETIKREGEEDYVFLKTNKIDLSLLKSHLILTYRLIFNQRDRISLKEFIYSIKNDAEAKRDMEIKYYAIKSDLDNELENLGIYNARAKKMLLKINQFSIELIFIIPFMIFFNFFIDAIIKDTRNLGLILFIIEILTIVLYFATNPDEEKVTKYGANLKQKIQAKKKYLEEYTIMDDKPFYMVNILDTNYIDAIAMGLADTANMQFSKKIKF